MNLDSLRYPIGRFAMPGALSPEEREECIAAIEALPMDLEDALEGLDRAQLETRYREGGWTVRQVAHHLVDSHVNSYCRLKLGLTEENPQIRLYDEATWAELADHDLPVENALDLLAPLHARWAHLWRSLDDAQFARTIRHAELGTMRLDELLAFYAWHGAHHVAHVQSVRDRSGI